MKIALSSLPGENKKVVQITLIAFQHLELNMDDSVASFLYQEQRKSNFLSGISNVFVGTVSPLSVACARPGAWQLDGRNLGDKQAIFKTTSVRGYGNSGTRGRSPY